MLTTPSGIEFAMLGGKIGAPAPAVLHFAWSARETLSNPDYGETARILSEKGFVCISVDMPCHGADRRKDDSAAELAGWPGRVEKGNTLVSEFTKKVTAVLDFTIQEKYTDPGKIAAFGISRGGFMAFHAAAADARIRCVAGLCPVTDLLALDEFANAKTDAARSLALASVADKLAGRSVWIVIGNDDQRVSTDSAIAFARKVTESSVAQHKPADVELHVAATPGHSQPEHSQRQAAEWIEKKVGKR